MPYLSLRGSKNNKKSVGKKIDGVHRKGCWIQSAAASASWHNAGI